MYLKISPSDVQVEGTLVFWEEVKTVVQPFSTSHPHYATRDLGTQV